MYARWPAADKVDELLLMEVNYLDELLHMFRVRIKKMLELKEKVNKSLNAIIINIWVIRKDWVIFVLNMESFMWLMNSQNGKQ